MAEVFGIISGGLTVLELTAKVLKQCKKLIETYNDAPRDLRHILIEVSSLKSVLESFDFLSKAEFSDTSQKITDPDGVVEGCRKTIYELSKELDKLLLVNNPNVAHGKYHRLKGSMQWYLQESKMRKLLDEAMQHKTTITLTVLGEIASDVKEIKSTVEQVQDGLSITNRRKICDWIEHINPTTIHNQSRKNHEEHTCQWIHRAAQWIDWLNRQRRLIWIHGIPGAGKTVLASYLIEQADAYCDNLDAEQAVCLYYYCSFRHGQEERRDEALPFLRWIVSQLCRRSDYIPAKLLRLHQLNSAPSFPELKEALQELARLLDVIYIVIDGIDESVPRADLLDLIRDIATQPRYENMQLLVTSRTYADIERVLRPLSEPSLPMSNSIVDADIRTFVSNTIQRDNHFAKWPRQLQSDVIQSLAQGSQGMFRWVVCQLDRLQRKSPQQAKQAINCLPKSLEDTYETMLLEIPEEDWHMARTALQWICGHSDLRFQHGIPANALGAAVLSSGNTSWSDFGHNGHEHDFLKVILGCLIEISFIDSDEDRVRWAFGDEFSVSGDSSMTCFHHVSLAHYTIEEFLFSDRMKKSPVSSFAMSRDTCAQTVLESVLRPMTEVERASLSPDLYRTLETYRYSAARVCPTYWETILLRSDHLWRQYFDFFRNHKHSWDFLCHDNSDSDGDLLGVHDVFEYIQMEDPTAIKTQYLIAILGLGCVDMAKRLLEELSLETTFYVSTPLTQAWSNDVGLTTQEGGPITILDAFGAHCSCHSQKVYYALFESLISSIEPSKLLIHYLEAHYHEDVCQEFCVIARLLGMGADLNSNYYLLTPLQIAVRNWDFAGIKLLLEHGADVDGTGQPHGYALSRTDTTWARCSPLHILRNAEYGFIAMEFTMDLKYKRAEKLSDIEGLLLEKGASDIVRPEPANSQLRKVRVQDLLN